MALRRVCFALLFVVCLDSVAGKPFFGDLWCNWVCDWDDDDDGTTTTSSTDDDYYGCNECGPQTRRMTTTAAMVTTTPAVIPGVNPTEFEIDIPPGNAGYRFKLTNANNGWKVMMVPNLPEGSQATSTTAAGATTAAGGTTAAATTAAGASTAAPATTAAATTAAK